MYSNNIPDELKQLNQWVVWGVDKEKIKMPFKPTTMKPAKAGDPSTWSNFYEASNRVKTGQAQGVGFEFNDNGIYGIDLDHVVYADGLGLDVRASEIVKLLDSYTELSPSGDGLHILVKASGVVLEANRKGFIEIYNKERYFTVTGNMRRGDVAKPIQERTAQLQAVYDKYLKPKPPEPKQQLTFDNPVKRRDSGYKSDEDYLNDGLKHDQLLSALWNGDRPNGNESADDIALFNKLAYWCNGNTSLMESAFLSSPYYSQKDEAHKKKCDRVNYIDPTIRKAVTGITATARDNDGKFQQEKQSFRPLRPELPKHEVKPTANGYGPAKDSKLKIKRMSEIAPKTIEYLIEPYIPAGTFSIIAGQSGSTKTWFSLYLAALISNGGEFITDNPFVKREPQTVIYQSKENDYATVVRPRLDILKANLDNVIMIDDKDEDENGVSLTLTDGRLEEAIKTYSPALVILDPLQSYLGDDIDMHRANEVRPVLDKIIDLASRYNCAFVIIMHLSKMTTVGALDRILGTVDFRAAARSICVIGNDPEDPKRRILAHAKFNNGEYGQSIAYWITHDEGVSIEGFCSLTEDDIVQGKKKEGRDKPSVSLDEAKEFLLDILGENGYTKRNDIETAAEERGIKPRTLYNAKTELDIRHMTIGYSPKTTWWYRAGSPPTREAQQLKFIKSTE